MRSSFNRSFNCRNGYLIFFTAAVVLFSCSARSSKKNDPPCNDTNTARIASTLGLKAEKLTSETAVYSLEQGGENLTSRAWLCDNAEKTLDIQYYIFARDNTGLIACDFLLRAADRGVKIRLIIDDATVRPNTHEISLLDSHENIQIKVYNPGIKLGSVKLRAKKILTQMGKLHRRMHNKTIIVDNLVAITGGRNVADEYFDYHKKYNFRDRDVLLAGKAVPDVSRSFEQFWNDTLSIEFAELVPYKKKKKYSDPERFDKIHAYACDTENFSPRMKEKIKNFPKHFRQYETTGEAVWTPAVSFVSDPPGKNRDRPKKTGGVTTDSMIALIRNARRSIDIQSPYLILTDIGKDLFRDAVKRGVKVRVLTNSLSSTDNFEAFSAYRRDRDDILETGIEIYEYKPHPDIRFKVMCPEVQESKGYKSVLGMHCKSMLVDGKVTVIGSFNLDPRSADFNTECLAIIRSEAVTKNVANYVNEEFLPGNAWHTTMEYNPDSEAGFIKRIKLAPRRVVPKEIL
jgi:cardiolipin synthase C